jgi:putative ABC transport system permease protein
MNTQNIRLTFRNLQRNRLYSALSILGFSAGFAVCIITALYIYSEFTMDRCFPDYKRIVRVIDTKNVNCNLDYKLSEGFKEKFPQVEVSCPIELENGWDIKIKTENSFMKIQGMISTTNDFFRLFPVKVLRSTNRQPFSGIESVILTQSQAKLLFKDEDPLGKPIEITDILKGQVSAIIEDFPVSSSIRGNILINSANEKLRLSQNCNNGVCMNPTNHYLLLKQGTDLTGLAGTMNRDLLKNHPEIGKFSLQPFSEIYLSPVMDGSGIIPGNKSLVWIFLSVGLVVLILSIINFLNFYLSMQYAKLREIGIKKINGASFGQLLSYSFLEVSISIFIYRHIY